MWLNQHHLNVSTSVKFLLTDFFLTSPFSRQIASSKFCLTYTKSTYFIITYALEHEQISLKRFVAYILRLVR